MELTHRFTVPGAVEQTWSRFGDIGSLAECFPGAQVTSVEGDTFEGTVKVKLGPIALVYAGSGTFVDKDETAHTFRVEAKGRDKRGNGTAGANVTVTMGPEGEGTSVQVETDLSITGKPAQFGRGVMQDVSDKLLGQFVTCLEQKIGAEQAGPEPSSEEPAKPAEPAQAPDASPVVPVAGASTAADTIPAGAHASRASGDDAIDLGGAVLPVLVKHYGKYAAGGVLALVLLWLLRRLRS